MRYVVTVTTGREEIFSSLVGQAMRLAVERIEIVRLEDVKTTVRAHERVLGRESPLGFRRGRGAALVRSLLEAGPQRYGAIRRALGAAGMAESGVGGVLSKMRGSGEIENEGGLWRRRGNTAEAGES